MLALICAGAYASGDPQITTTFDANAVPRIEVGGKLLVDLNTEIMLTVTKDSKAANWFNAGYLWGDFGDFGFAKYEYPTVGTVDGVRAITFNGKSKLIGSPVVPKDKINDGTKGNLATPDSMTGTGEYAIEVWAYNPTVEPNECMVSWSTGYLAYPDAKYASAKKWHHIVVVHSGGQDTLYVDGKQQAQGKFISPAAGKVEPLAPISLGVTADGKQNFSGSIAALRIHEKPITADQIAKNFAGGVALGTVCIPNIDPGAGPDDPTWGPSDNPKLKQNFSKHFRMMLDPAKDVNNIQTEEKSRKMLEDYEQVYDLYEADGHGRADSVREQERPRRRHQV